MGPIPPSQSLHELRSCQAHFYGLIEIVTERVRRGGDALRFDRRQWGESLEVQHDPALLEGALPDADQLTVNDDDVGDERVGAGDGGGVFDSLADRATVAVANVVLVVGREEMSRPGSSGWRHVLCVDPV